MTSSFWPVKHFLTGGRRTAKDTAQIFSSILNHLLPAVCRPEGIRHPPRSTDKTLTLWPGLNSLQRELVPNALSASINAR